jgi:hypothetical protein
MGINEIVGLLIAERDRIERAIQALGGTSAKRRGRPPRTAVPVAAAVASPAPATQPGKRKGLSPAQRKAHSERMKAFWAARRKAKK